MAEVRQLESLAMSFRGVPVVAVWACAGMPPMCAECKDSFEELKDPPWVNEKPKEMKFLRIATLNVLTLSPAQEREANCLRGKPSTAWRNDNLRRRPLLVLAGWVGREGRT